jgi:cadmium resistance protein CadD (predicted permease)
MLVSLIGFFGGRTLPHEWIRWLGIAPIFLGLKRLIAKRGDIQHIGSNTFSVAAVTFTCSLGMIVAKIVCQFLQLDIGDICEVSSGVASVD